MGRQISAKFYPEPTEEVIQEIAVGKLKKRQQAMELRNRCQGFQQNQILTNKPANSLNTTDPYSYHPRSQQNVQYHAYADYQFFQNQTARQSILHENLCNPHIQPKYNQHLQKQQFTHQQQHQHSLRIRTEGAFAPSPISPSPISPMSPLSPVTDNFANSKGFNPAIWTYTGKMKN
ncbi:hypothetical protein HK099_004168 [Clydaea vesicula]|uniref:Uncharacterized protein n=1 Tax=Clydaea vesicula TaxID=447962 RepID=A0AAD5UA05_9FUNG|nr:hypothetical protein HK099_004168 [Clydaea vesicula]